MKNSSYNKNSLRLWFVKKILKNHLNKEEMFSFITDLFPKNEEIVNNNLNKFKDVNENELISNILEISNKTVQDIMIPRAEIISVSNKSSLDEILKLIDEENHSRMPVYEDNLDNVIGMIHVKDILEQIRNKNFLINNIVRDILYVAPSSSVLDLLKRMRKSKIHLGLVVDEHGGIDGLVSIEDLVEEIVGEIEDEHDAEDYEIKIRKINSETYIVDSSVLLTEIENLLNLKFLDSEKNEIDTIGGLVFYISGKIPSVAEKFTHNSGIVFEVLEASERRIDKIKIKYNNRDKLY
tara:strand:+ start:96 stop:977 length:882 start_codon:yes stop_codon:yes gene_type:complete